MAYKNPISEFDVRQMNSKKKKRLERHIWFLPQYITQSLDVGITTTSVETFIAPTMNFLEGES